jgi:ankyrin repeat protein
VLLALLGAGCAGEERESSADADGELIVAARAGDVDRVRSLLERDAAVDARDASGATALVAAAYGNHVDVARSLIEAGADVNVKDERQQSAYLIATSEVGDDPRLLELTLANGADVDAKDSYNGTGLIRAADRGHVRIVERLLETEVEIDHVNRLGWTALLEAIILGGGDRGHTEVVRLLVEAGADVNLADGDGVTPLAHARRQGYDVDPQERGVAVVVSRGDLGALDGPAELAWRLLW